MAAPNTYKVVKLLKSEQWKNDSPNVTHEILVEGSDRVWKAHQIKEKNHPTPVEGQELQGWMNDDKGTIGLAAPRGSSGSGRTGGGGSQQGEDPQRSARIVRQHSQEMALRYLQAGGIDFPDPDNRTDTGLFLNGALRPLIDWFAKDAHAATPPPAQAQLADRQRRGPGAGAGACGCRAGGGRRHSVLMKPYVTLAETPSELQAQRVAKFHTERLDAPQPELDMGAGEWVIRVVKCPLGWQVQRWPLAALLARKR